MYVQQTLAYPSETEGVSFTSLLRVQYSWEVKCVITCKGAIKRDEEAAFFAHRNYFAIYFHF